MSGLKQLPVTDLRQTFRFQEKTLAQLLLDEIRVHDCRYVARDLARGAEVRPGIGRLAIFRQDRASLTARQPTPSKDGDRLRLESVWEDNEWTTL